MASKKSTEESEDERGLKRICDKCSTRFYDFFKRPIICPSCDTEFTPQTGGKSQTKREEKS